MKTDATITIAISDDHPVMRLGVKELINSLDGYEVTIEASDGSELLKKINQNGDEVPDICVMELCMKGMGGYETLAELKNRWPAMKVLIYSLYYDDFLILQAMRKGANGFLSKESSARHLAQALSSVHYTDYYCSDSIKKKIFDLNKSKSMLLPNITEREMEFLRHCCSEHTYEEIGRIMNISKRTVEAYRDTLFVKFNIKTRTGLAMFALQNGIISLRDLKRNDSHAA